MEEKIKLVKTSDGSYTFFSTEYDECYHSVKGGAILESFYKFSLPLYKDLLQRLEKEKVKNLKILDIGFGLGYNVLSLLYLQEKYFPNITLEIISIEKDKKLFDVITWDNLPEPLNRFSYILEILKQTKEKIYYLGFPSATSLNNNLSITVILEDIRKVFLRLKNIYLKFDYIFHDAFSFLKNPEAWTYEIFLYEKNLLKDKGKIFTYACAKPIKRALLENKFSISLNKIKDNFFKEHINKILEEIKFTFSVPEKYKNNPIKSIFEIFERHPGLEATKGNFTSKDFKLLEELEKDRKSAYYRDNIYLNKNPNVIKLERDNKINRGL